ncbi:L-seryl-tRNA(Sec) selenium transferase [candidate division WOR-3 bacterium]|nr:L-seryl-tRNA(Sec) selenium transferase [candidate division WOR-3 bacterium]
MNNGNREKLRKIPSIDKLLSKSEIKPYLKRFPRKFVKACCKTLLEEIREDILKKRKREFSLKSFIEALEVTFSYKSHNIINVVNATGVILNTNLGRAPLPERLVDSIKPILTGYSNLEYNLQKGKRGKRRDHLIGLLKDLTGAEDAFVVNNNAGAVLLCLDTFAKGKEVIVSRGQLVEIGGSFRLPEILKTSGAKLVEVGTTNRTYIDDFRKAITPDTRMLLLSHRSNFRIVGFTKDPSVEEIVLLGKEKGIITMMDLGSGLLISMEKAGLRHEPTVKEIVDKKIDIVSFSGDKLLGGPQAGIILGKKEFVTVFKNSPLSRALRIDKFTISALEVILRIYLYSDDPVMELPGLRMAFIKNVVIKKRAQTLKNEIIAVTKKKAIVEIEKGFSEMGGGSMPAEVMPTYLVTIKVKGIKEEKLLKLLRENNPPVIARIEKDRVVMDPRTIFPNEIKDIKEAMREICGKY